MKIEIEVKIGEQNRQLKDKIWRKFHNFQQKDSLTVTSERREENAEFQNELNGIQLKIQTKVKMKNKLHLKEKICKILQF